MISVRYPKLAAAEKAAKAKGITLTKFIKGHLDSLVDGTDTKSQGLISSYTEILPTLANLIAAELSKNIKLEQGEHGISSGEMNTLLECLLASMPGATATSERYLTIFKEKKAQRGIKA